MASCPVTGGPPRTAWGSRGPSWRQACTLGPLQRVGKEGACPPWCQERACVCGACRAAGTGSEVVPCVGPHGCSPALLSPPFPFFPSLHHQVSSRQAGVGSGVDAWGLGFAHSPLFPGAQAASASQGQFPLEPRTTELAVFVRGSIYSDGDAHSGIGFDVALWT